MKKRNKTYRITIDPYSANLVIILTSFPDKVSQKILNARCNTSVKTDNAFFIYDIPDSKKYIIIFPHNPTSDIIAHECFHLVYKLLNTSGSKLNNYTEEQYAYLIGHIVGLVTDKINRFKKRK